MTRLAKLLDTIEAELGPPAKPDADDPLGLILWENVAYLVDDDRRRAAFRALDERVGLSADAILGAPDEVLHEISKLGGMHPDRRVQKLRAIASLASEQGDDLRGTLDLEPKKARTVFKRFPGIGDPGADKLLLFCGIAPVLALESNGLRSLLRLGYGVEQKSYAASYRSAREAAEAELPERRPVRMRAYGLLRKLGQELCKNSAPRCGSCPLKRSCPTGKGRRAS